MRATAPNFPMSIFCLLTYQVKRGIFTLNIKMVIIQKYADEICTFYTPNVIKNPTQAVELGDSRFESIRRSNRFVGANRNLLNFDSLILKNSPALSLKWLNTSAT